MIISHSQLRPEANSILHLLGLKKAMPALPFHMVIKILRSSKSPVYLLGVTREIGGASQSQLRGQASLMVFKTNLKQMASTANSCNIFLSRVKTLKAFRVWVEIGV